MRINKSNSIEALPFHLIIGDLSKIETDQIQINRRLLFANKLVSNIYEEYLLKANEKGIELKLDLSHSYGIIIDSDETKISKILVNLVGNAIKFTKKGLILLGIKKISDFVQFQIKTTEIGISEEFDQQIFDPFRQVETVLTRQYGGNGLGLAISKSMVELLGGSIWMESARGEGYTFYFTIPY